MEFHEWLRGELERRRMTQAAFARAINIEQGSVSRWLKADDPTIPTPKMCRRIADELGLDAHVVLQFAGHLGEMSSDDGPPDPRSAFVEQEIESLARHLEEAAERLRRYSAQRSVSVRAQRHGQKTNAARARVASGRSIRDDERADYAA